jgi:hypothetical protein
MFLAILTTILFLTNSVYSHSHLECVKKQGSLNCLGFPRYYHFNALNTPLPSSSGNLTFYASRDRFWHPYSNFGLCPPKLSNDLYTINYPMASAYPGETVTTQHPPRGHDSQPNSNVEIYMHKSSGITEQPSLSNMKLLASFPFTQNCIGLQQEISWANCTGDFTIPSDTKPGIYTFFWLWNLTSIPYSDCFEINVQGNFNKTPTQSFSNQVTVTSSLPEYTCLCK